MSDTIQPSDFFTPCMWLGFEIIIDEIKTNFSRLSARHVLPYKTDCAVVVEDLGIGPNEFVAVKIFS